MRIFKKTEPDKFNEIYNKETKETVGEHILRKGTMRSQEAESKQYTSHDFKGQNFFERRKRYLVKATHPKATKEEVNALVANAAAAVLSLRQSKAREAFQNFKQNDSKKHWKIIEELISTGADLSELYNDKHETPLQVILEMIDSPTIVQAKLVQQILQRGVNINNQDKNGKTALMSISYSCVNSYETALVADELIKNGSNLTLKDCLGRTALHYVAQNGTVETASLLLKHAPSLIHEKNNEGWTVLMEAVAMSKKSLISLFIDEGVDVSAKATKERKGFTSWAAGVNVLDIAKYTDAACGQWMGYMLPLIEEAVSDREERLRGFNP